MKIKADFKKIYLEQGKTQYQEGNYSEAIDLFDKAMQLGIKPQECCPELDDSHYILARCCCKNNNWKIAKRHISKALQYNPSSVLYQRLTLILDENIKDPQASMELYLNKYGTSYNMKSRLQTLLEYAENRGSLIEVEDFDPHRFSPLILKTYCVGAYRSAYDKDSGNLISVAIRRAKKEDSNKTLLLFGKVMVEYLLLRTSLADCLDLVIPVPADSSRRIERGYHIVEDMKVPFERVIALPVFEDIVEKIKDTPPVRGYSKNVRAKILSGAFRLINPTIIKNRNVLIIDEVLTYGTTICEVARTIKEGNPKGIYALVFSKSERSKG